MRTNKKIEKLNKSKKISIFGWPATGKSTFSQFLSNKLNLPVYHLDQLRWKNLENGKKNDEKFLIDYEEILRADSWIVEGNALDWIESRLNQSDILLFFESTPSQSINKVKNRDNKIKLNKEERVGFENDISENNKTFYDWIRYRFNNKIKKLRKILKGYKDKTIIIKNYKSIDKITKKINKF